MDAGGVPTGGADAPSGCTDGRVAGVDVGSGRDRDGGFAVIVGAVLIFLGNGGAGLSGAEGAGGFGGGTGASMRRGSG